MERRLSMINTANATASHRRTHSTIKTIPKASGPSLVQLYLTNLRLLNLDILPDWPGISTLTFSSGSDNKQRIKAVEWSLYQLFRLYDAQLTTEKLRPFFPPLESLQSLNLRAALYRCLTELKKNGVLGREVVLRKTMLDECSGEKFWELCLSFSAVVLRKITLEYQENSRQHQPVAQRLGSASQLNKKDRESLLPLAIAHKSALSKVLAEKHERRQSYARFSRVLDEKDADLVRRRHSVAAAPHTVRSVEHSRQLQVVEETVSGHWSTDNSFKDAIIHGDPAGTDDHLLLQTSDEFLDSINSGSPESDQRRDSGIVEDIEVKARAQNARVKDWQALHEQLQANHRHSITSLDSSSRDTSCSSQDLQFDQHQDLTIDDDLPPPSPIEEEPAPAYVSKYDEILNSMREELRRTHSLKQAQAASGFVRRQSSKQELPRAPSRKPSVQLDSVAGASRPAAVRSPSMPSASPTFPLRPGLGRRVSSRSRSYQQPKVISQREPIPLKTEILSPTKSMRNMSPMSAGSSWLASPIDQDEVSIMDDNNAGSGASTPATDNGNGAWPSRQTKKGRNRPSESRTVSFADQPSLSERTRLSMIAAPVEESEPDFADDLASAPVGRHALSDRTRKSMSGVKFPVAIRTSISQPPSNSMDVLSPPKLRSIATHNDSMTMRTIDLLEAVTPVSADRNITPQEKLFEADAQYSSVFKSRPKIASSPVLSPINGIDDEPQTSRQL